MATALGSNEVSPEGSALRLLLDEEGRFWRVLENHWAQQPTEVTVPLVVGSRWRLGGYDIDPFRLFAAGLNVQERRASNPILGVMRGAEMADRITRGLGVPKAQGFRVWRLFNQWLRPMVDALADQPAALVIEGMGDVPCARTPAPARDEVELQQHQAPLFLPPPPPPPSIPPSLETTAPTTGASRDEMSQPQPQPVIVVDTPSNRRGKFSREDASSYPPNIEPKLASMVPEPTPRIYRHCVMGLASPIENEKDFALHHLVVISDERGDKFLFRDFPGLAESLVETVLGVSKLTHGVEWELDYDLPNNNNNKNNMRVATLNAASGTQDLLDRLEKLDYIFPKDDFEDSRFANEFRRVFEASLVLRNMVIEEENARWVDDIDILRDCAAMVLSLPNDDRFMELKSNILEIVEECSRYWKIWETDPLYTVLAKQFDSKDRNVVLTALSGFVMFAVNTNQTQKATHNIPWGKVKHLIDLTYLDNDPELLSAILDFLYQYTLTPLAIDVLRKHLHLPTTIVKRMTELLVYEAEVLQQTYIDRPTHRAPAARDIPFPPGPLYAALMQFPEPQRTTAWLKCCFVEDPECEVTQLALWQAYQNVFAERLYSDIQPVPTQQATEFISTITGTFTTAQAKIVDGPMAKYVLKGIRPLETVYDLRGFPYYFCKWGRGTAHECQHVDQNAGAFTNHVLREHLKVMPTIEGWRKIDPADQTAYCLWDGCFRARHTGVDFNTLMEHVFTHLPEPRTDPNIPPPKPQRPFVKASPSRIFEYFDTPKEISGEPVGIAYKAALILRNIQWGLPNTMAGSRYKHKTWTKAMFGSIRTRLLEIAAYNRSLAGEIFALAGDIDKYSVIVPADQDNRW